MQLTCRLFNFVFKCPTLGLDTLLAGGIGAILEQLAAELPGGSLLAQFQDGSNGGVVAVKLENGRELRAAYGIVVAVEETEASRLLEANLPTPLHHLFIFSSDKEASDHKANSLPQRIW